MKYELAVAHRVCPVLAKTAAYYDDKLEMVKVTARSLASALNGIHVKLIVILDGCSVEYEQLFDNMFSGLKNLDYERISTPAIGNQATYAKQHEWLSAQADKSEFLYFSEDDYLYRKDAFFVMMRFLKNDYVDFVTPLDHPDRYGYIVPENRRTEIRVSEDCHWREVGTTCCTFMTKSQTFHMASRRLSDYGSGCGDAPMWIGLTKNSIFMQSATIGAALRYLFYQRKTPDGLEFMTLAAWRWYKWRLPFGHKYRLWSPMPTQAIHLCKPSLPPFYEKMMKEIL